MADECRPPEGTPDGAVCRMEDALGARWEWRWDGTVWRDTDLPYDPCTPSFAGILGFRFHSIPVPPDA